MKFRQPQQNRPGSGAKGESWPSLRRISLREKMSIRWPELVVWNFARLVCWGARTKRRDPRSTAVPDSPGDREKAMKTGDR